MTGSGSVANAVTRRRSVRAFLDQPVDRADIEELLSLAAHAPSNGNTQPWRVHVLMGDSKARLSKSVFARAAESPMGDEPDVVIYPAGLADPWRQRRFDCGERLYETLGISREDKQGRMLQGAKNLTFFDAPVGLIITLDRSLGGLQMLDCGIFVQTVMLLAEERGLATCPQAVWSMWSGTIRKFLGLPDDQMVLMGMALGYADTSDIAADIPMPRIAPGEFADFHGFD